MRENIESSYTYIYMFCRLDTYTERDVRLHISRLRDLLGGPYKPNPSTIGIDPSISFLTAITGEIGTIFVNLNFDKSHYLHAPFKMKKLSLMPTRRLMIYSLMSLFLNTHSLMLILKNVPSFQSLFPAISKESLLNVSRV